MESHDFRITAYERQALLEQYRKGVSTQVRLRAHILLLLAAGYWWAVIAEVLFCSSRTIARWKSRVELAGVSAILRPAPPPGARLDSWWSAVVVRWVLEWTPQDFDFVRSRWCCGAMVWLLLEIYELQVSRETVRRWLPREQLVWRRPRPLVGPTDPEREAKLHALRQLLAALPPNEIAVFQDEVDINTNPKIGSMWMRRGHQAVIPPPAPTRNATWRVRSTGAREPCW